MKRILLTVILCFSAAFLEAAEFTLSAGKLKAVFETKGGALKDLYFGGKGIIFRQHFSFTEKVLRSEGKKQIIEDFSTLEFTPVALTENSITFSALGVQNFDFLRVTKTFTINGRNNTLTLKYNFKNISSKDSAAGIWSRTMLRRFDGMGMRNSYFYFKNGQMITALHPGNVRDDFWVENPSSAAAAFMGNDDKTGGVLLPPRDLICSFYSWFDGAKDVSTLEYFLREQKIPAGKSVSFETNLIVSGNVPELLKKYAKRTLTAPKGNVPVWLDYYIRQDKSVIREFSGNGFMPRSRKTLDIQGKRQYCDSIRGIRIPGTVDKKQISVYALANKSPEYDRPIPFTVEKLPSGEQRILVLVPGVNKQGFYFTRFKDGFAYNILGKAPGFAGKDTFFYRICFDLKSKKSYPADLFKGGPDLVYNGSLERKKSNAEWPDGFNWSYHVRSRNLFSWVKEGVNNSRCIKLSRPKGSKFYCIWPVFFRTEPGVKYSFSARMRSENPERAWVTCMIEFNDDKKKNIPRTRINVFNRKNSYPWTDVANTFFKPLKAEYGVVRFGANSPSQQLWVDDVKIVPEDFTYTMRTPLQIMRDEVKVTNYPSLDLLEKLSGETVTPHTKWLANPANPMPEILYLPLATTRGIQYSAKRQIIEFAQRMKLNWKFIPMLRWIESNAKSWDINFGKKFEPYTIAQLKAITKVPAAVIVQDINFKAVPSEEFINILHNFQKKGSGIMFYNCRNVPARLLGKRIAVPEGIFATPVFRKISRSWADRACTAWQNGKSRVICFTRNRSEFYLEAQNFACVPRQFAWERCPSYYSYDFPYWEYIYVSALKSLRYVAGVEPEVKVTGNLKQGILLKARHAQQVRIHVTVKDMHRRKKAEFSQNARLKAGLNRIDFKLPALSGGENVADYRITDLKGREYDFGSLNFTIPDKNRLSVSFADKEKVFNRGSEVKVKVSAAGAIPRGSVLEYSVEDTRSRVVVMGSMKARSANDISFKVLPPYTTLYRLHLCLKSGKKELSRGFAEFSMPTKAKDLTFLDSLIWLGRTPYARLASEMGFTMWIADFMQNNESMGRFKAVRNSNMEPVMFGAGRANYDTGDKYRHDIPSDPVRTPCFSDPEHWKKAGAIIRDRVTKQRYRYYGILHHEIADEAYLGSTVCFSPHCLKGFRAEMKKQYGSLEALNKAWKRNFKNWENVIPEQLKAVNGSDNLAPWLDHKMFMAKTFAANWVGRTGKELRRYVPQSKVGLSGTQIPGYSYDWVQLMKHIDCLSYYGGIQRKAVHDFAAPGFVSGMWGGGYAKGENENEFYQKSPIWSDLFLGANMVSNFAGYCYNGDITPVKNTLYYCELVNEIRKGIDRMILNAREINRDIAVLYSQSSLFAAMGGVGAGTWHNSQTGWAALLEDLKLNYFYLPYDQLDKTIPQAKVVILPAAISLSEKAVANLQKFTAAGGTVIADFAPGWFNEHGIKVRNAGVEKLFGISRASSDLAVAGTQIQSKPYGIIPAIKGDFRIGEKQLAAKGSVTLGEGKALFINKYGKGRAVLLNILLSGYQDISLGGVGGEQFSVKSGAALFCDNMRKIMAGIMKTAGVASTSTVTEAASGKLYPCTTMLRKDGENYVFGILKSRQTAPDGKFPMRFDKKFAKQLKVKLAVKGHIYDVRKGKYLGCTDTIKIDLIPGDGQVFAIQRNKCTGVKLDLPAVIFRGREVTVKFKTSGSVGAQIFRLDLIAPDGKIAKVYTRTGRFPASGGIMKFQLALNDSTGKWKFRITHVNSGTVAERTADVR